MQRLTKKGSRMHPSQDGCGRYLGFPQCEQYAASDASDVPQ